MRQRKLQLQLSPYLAIARHFFERFVKLRVLCQVLVQLDPMDDHDLHVANCAIGGLREGREGGYILILGMRMTFVHFSFFFLVEQKGKEERM